MSCSSLVAVVGQGCVLPGAFTPEALFSLVRDRRSAVDRAPAGRWGVRDGSRGRLEREVASDVGGYVRGFERVFDPHGFLLPAALLDRLDPVCRWPLHAAREALSSAGIEIGAPQPRAAVMLGNLSYPTRSLADFALEVWHGEPAPGAKESVDPLARFMSGYPAHLVAQALGFQGDAFCLDAACASSLYAIKLACDQLVEGKADLVLAGGVNAADELCLHLGFSALSAMSPTGRSRPFHSEADGLVPATGAVVFALERLEDAQAEGRPILGVIRGIGLSNDGRGAGLLVPSEAGQVAAMRAAYDVSGIGPEDISLLECHATGTKVGDAVELRSMRKVFGESRPLPIGSLKSNLGHLITAAGAGGLLKVLCAMRAGVLPPTLHVDETSDREALGPFRLLAAEEPWVVEGPRRAAVSAFGFGGNNAHLVVEEWRPDLVRPGSAPRRSAHEARVAVVAQEVVAGPLRTSDELAAAFSSGRSLLGGDPPCAPAEAFEIDAQRLAHPPADLARSLAQQVLPLSLAQRIADAHAALAGDRTGVFIGMQCDAEAARYAPRFRSGPLEDDCFVHGMGEASTAEVVGIMPNVVANRLSRQLDLRGPCFTVSSEEASGTTALELARLALARGELDAALVGAVDLSCEPVQRAAAVVLGSKRRAPGDAAVLMLLKRLEDAERDGDEVLAVLEEQPEPSSGLSLRHGPDTPGLSTLVGHAHAASGLLHVAAGVEALSHRALPGPSGVGPRPFLPGATGRSARVDVFALGGRRTTTALRSGPRARARALIARPPRLALFSAESMDALLDALRRGEESDRGSIRLAVLLHGDEREHAILAHAHERLAMVRAAPFLELSDGLYFGAGRVDGSVAALLARTSASYPQMGRELALACPDAIDAVVRVAGAPGEHVASVYSVADGSARLPAEAEAHGARFLALLHAEIARSVLRVAPTSILGGDRELAESVANDARIEVSDDETALVESAYAEGSRVFLELGPGDAGARAVRRLLEGRPHVAVPFDRRDRASSAQLVDAVARLFAAGVPVDHRAAVDLLARASSRPRSRARGPAAPVIFDAHWAPMRLRGWPEGEPRRSESGSAGAPIETTAIPVPSQTAPRVLPMASTIERLLVHQSQLTSRHLEFLERQREALSGFLVESLEPLARTSPAKPSVPSPPWSAPSRPAPTPTGPRFGRAELEVHASGKISSIFGPLFAKQDGYARQVRMPEPPLLLADRVTGLTGEPGGMGRGTIFTETDVPHDAWYLHAGHMPASIMVESGQADLMLISWLGADFLNQGERVYRLLGCDLTCHGPLPKAGDTLCYDIHVDGHATLGGVRLFFFHYDCRIDGEIRLSVRNGQAGFFSYAELTDSKGILWNPAEAEPTPNARLDAPRVSAPRNRLGHDEVQKLAAGRVAEVLGEGFEATSSHVRTPTIAAGRMCLLREVTHLDPHGGPWGRGHLRAVLPLAPDLWFFRGHFKNDPCMPGTLMLEGCLEAMALYMIALGYTIDRDGWRFEPVPDQEYKLRCRGQATPASRQVVYELFVDELVDGTYPTLYADILGSVDGLHAFQCRRMGLRLVPG